MYDPKFVSFAQWLYTRSADSIAGPLARHFLANAFLPGVVGADGNFTPTITEHNGASMAHPGNVCTSAPLSWVSAPFELAAQALRWRTFDGLNISARHYGPNVTQAEYDAAVAAFQGS
jgi:hypothetical protein